jgi:XTP/dITP diphosphohydrolase
MPNKNDIKILVATNNAGKLREIRALLAGVTVVSPTDLKLNLDVEESGATFAANAALKAHAFAAASGLIALADDSGLQVDALDGAPGVLSARYGGPGLDDEGRMRLLLSELKPFADLAQRTARFNCTVVAAAPDGRTCRAAGTCEGHIAHQPNGDGGFGYDPVFFLPKLNCTMAQLRADEKNKISHRAHALASIEPLLFTTFPELRA